MLFTAFLVLLAIATAIASKAKKPIVAPPTESQQPNGGIVAAQFRCTTPCQENYRLTLSRYDVIQEKGVDNDVEVCIYVVVVLFILSIHASAC